MGVRRHVTIQLTRLFQTLRTVFTPQMSSECIHSKFDLAREPIHMIGPSVHSCIQERMLVEEIHVDITIAVFLVQIFGRVLAEELIHVNMHMESLNAGCILLSIEPGFVKMALIVTEEFASLLILQKSFDLSMFPLDLQFLLRGHRLLVWICL